MLYRDDFSCFLSESDDSDNERGNYFVYFLGHDGEIYSVLHCEAYRRVPLGCKVYESEYEAERASRLLRFRLSQAQKPQQPVEPPTQSDVQQPSLNEVQPVPQQPKTYKGKPVDASWRQCPDGTYDNRPSDPEYFKNYYNTHYKGVKVKCEICQSELVIQQLRRHQKISRNCLKMRALREELQK